MKQVLIFPPWDPWLGNRMFTGAEGCVYTEAFQLWRECARNVGFLLDTWDTKPLESAHCVWMMDLPRRRRVFEEAKRAARPGVPFVLQVLESPVISPQTFVAANRKCFDAVVSYEYALDEMHQQFHYRLPNALHGQPKDTPFQKRRCSVMLNTNRVEGWFAIRQQGWEGLPGIGRYLTGWELPVERLPKPAGKGELYSWRRRLARAADKLGSDVLDVYGAGWSGELISWCPAYPNAAYRCAENSPYSCEGGSESRASKVNLFSKYRFGIGTENYRGSLGYISEKIFDVIQAGTVPVYVGDERIAKAIPPESFVDARRFRDHRELLLYLRSCGENEWGAMRAAGQSFLNSSKFREFGVERFVGRMIRALAMVLAGEQVGAFTLALPR